MALNLADEWIKEQDEKRKRFEAKPARTYVPMVEVKRYTRRGELIEVEDDAPGEVIDFVATPESEQSRAWTENCLCAEIIRSCPVHDI